LEDKVVDIDHIRGRVDAENVVRSERILATLGKSLERFPAATSGRSERGRDRVREDSR